MVQSEEAPGICRPWSSRQFPWPAWLNLWSLLCSATQRDDTIESEPSPLLKFLGALFLDYTIVEKKTLIFPWSCRGSSWRLSETLPPRPNPSLVPFKLEMGLSSWPKKFLWLWAPILCILFLHQVYQKTTTYYVTVARYSRARTHTHIHTKR